MTPCIAQYFVACFVISSNIVVFQVSGQCTVQGCEVGDPSISIVAEIQEIKGQQDVIIKSLHAVDRRSLEQDVCMKQIQGIYDFLNASFLQLRHEQDTLRQIESQQDTVTTNLQADNSRLQEQVQSMFQFLNSSLQQMKTQQDTATSNLQADNRRSQEQVQSMFQFLNSSLQQITTQQDTATTNLRAVDRRLSLCDTSISNQNQNLWKLAKVIMHRFNGSVNFNRTWAEYRNGFGDKEQGEFWLGNEKVHSLTSKFYCTLRIEVQLKASTRWYYAEYSTFSLESENNKYALRVSGYSGNASDSLTSASLHSNYYHGGMMFSTWDNDNDRSDYGNCGRDFGCGWWFNYCVTSCLTCHYLNQFMWHYPGGWPSSGLLRAARMMIKCK